MAVTTFGLNDALTVKLWSKSLDNEVLKYTDITPLIGDDANSVIQRKMETSKGSGDLVKFGLRMQLSGDGFSETDTAEGNGESLTIYSDSVTINELGHVVGVKSENSIDAQRVPFNLRAEARDGLADWYAKRLSVSLFNQICGNTATSGTGFPSSVKYTGLQAATAPTSTRKLLIANVATDELLTTQATHSMAATNALSFIDRAKEIAETSSPKIRPVKVGPGNSKQEQDAHNALLDKYLMFFHPIQITDMRNNTSTGQWLDIQKAAMAGADSTKSPIYTGAIGEYNGVILKQSIDVTNGVNSTTGALLPNVRRAVLVGAQAAVMAYGEKNSPGKYRWNEELFDHKRRLEVSAWSVWGLKKTIFNSVDFGTVVLSTYASSTHT